MPGYNNNNALNLTQLHTVTALLKMLLETLGARIDSQVTAATDPDSEIVDARVDTWGNTHASLGTNIREGQLRQSIGLQLVQESHQEQIDELASLILEETASVAEALETRRLETSTEEESRIAKDKILQSQIDTLSNAILNIVTTISALREKSRNQEE